MNPPSNQHIITTVVATMCVLAFICVLTLALCAFWKIPSMSDSLSSGFTHIADTILGALIAMLVNTRSQEQRKEPPPSSTPVSPSGAMAVALVNPDGSPVSEEKPLPVEQKPNS